MQNCLLELNNISVEYKTRLSFFRYQQHKALDNVSFDVKKGETIGIIGKNGCGKSTILKVIAGIYKPDSGNIINKAQSTSLLTLGLGFDPELSGEDNAIISAMLMGVSKQKAIEILPSIIEFSELGEFIKQPVKSYSSGMRSRLGFSVAIKLEVELMLVDEVLSVGDAGFRAKAEKAMLEKICSDQTVIFVSHSEGQVKRLCKRAIWLDKGKVKMVGDSDEVFEAYKTIK